MRLLALLVIIPAGLALGQEPPLPSAAPTAPSSATPSPAPSIPPPVTPPPQLIAPDVLPPLKPSELRPEVPEIADLDAGFAPAPLGPAAEEQRMHQEWRRLRNQVRNDPDLRAALRHAETAPTDLEKRLRLADYYELLYAKLSRRSDKGMQAYLAKRKRQALGALPQPRVRPEAFPEVAPVTPTPGVTPTPEPRLTPPGAPLRP